MAKLICEIGPSGSGRHSEKAKAKARVAFKAEEPTDELEELRRVAEEKKLLESQVAFFATLIKLKLFNFNLIIFFESDLTQIVYLFLISISI
jgi:hypothetical protein